jgi:hypothetical protein
MEPDKLDTAEQYFCENGYLCATSRKHGEAPGGIKSCYMEKFLHSIAEKNY